MYFKRMELEVWFDKWQFHCNVDIGESAIKWKRISDLGISVDDLPLRYGHHTGLPELKEQIVKDYDGLTTDNILVSSGGSEAIFSVFAALMKPGDHMVCETPNYPSNYGIPQGLGMEVSLCSMDFENDYRLDLPKIKSMVKENTKVLSITHPNNPTGCVLTEAELRDLCAFCKEQDIYLLSDETYRDMYLENKPPPACTIYDKAISITSMSKCFGLPGCRVGWLACKDPHLMAEVLTVREYVSITNNSIGEFLATEVLKKREEMLTEHRAHIEKNKKVVTAWVDANEHIEWVYPVVGVVGFPRLKDHVLEVLDHPNDLFILLADKYKTFTVPGGMMDCDPRHFRVGFGATMEELKKGLANFDAALAELMEGGGGGAFKGLEGDVAAGESGGAYKRQKTTGMWAGCET